MDYVIDTMAALALGWSSGRMPRVYSDRCSLRVMDMREMTGLLVGLLRERMRARVDVDKLICKSDSGLMSRL